MPATVRTIRPMRLADLCDQPRKVEENMKRIVAAFSHEPTREDDERLLAAMTEAEQLGLQIVVDDDEAIESASAYVSEYLKRPLRTEAEARAERAARDGKVHSVFAPILNWWRGQ